MDRNQLYHDHEHLVETTIYKMYIMPHEFANYHYMSYEDLVQYGKYGLWKACLSYDPTKAKFETHAINNIRGYIRTGVRDHGTLVKFHEDDTEDVKSEFHKQETSIYTIIKRGDNSSPMFFHETLSAYGNLEREMVFKATFEKEVNKLKDKERSILLMKLDGMKTKEIKEILNCSQVYIDRIYKQTLEKLKSLFESELNCI